MSLNSFLLKGPDQLTSLLAILFRFREKPVAICGDIREMFHQVCIREKDQQVQRFLWRNDPADKLDTYVMRVMTFGASCSPSSAQFIKNTNARQFTSKFPKAVKAILYSHYVDDLLESVESEEEAVKLAKDVKTIHEAAGFEIRNWASNSKTVMHSLGDKVSNVKNFNLNPESLSDEKVLGMWWSTSADYFTYSLSTNKAYKHVLKDVHRPTKREVLRVLMSIFDPMGLLAHFMIYLKILLQKIWRSSTEWDEDVNDLHFAKWCSWIRLLPQVEQIQIPRCYLSNSTGAINNIQLHVFVDAGEDAFAAVCYFRIETETGINCALIGAKSRVAPLKCVSIPRLELEAATLGSRYAVTIRNSHFINISSTHFWTDSKTVICWLNADHKRYQQFVAFRVGEILETSEAEQWRWLPSRLNVADEATKWQSPPNLNSDGRWYQGPDFLRLPNHMWPEKTDKANNPDEITTNEEIRPHLHHSVTILPRVIDFEDFSEWRRLLRVQAYIFRYIDNLRCKMEKKTLNLGPLTREEYVKATSYLYRLAQDDVYKDEVTLLKKNENAPIHAKRFLPKASPLYTRSPYLDNFGVIRSFGRIDAAIGVNDDTKRPVLLPKKHHITNLLIMSYHKRYGHHNHNTAINDIRQRYCIPRLRATYKSVIKSCQNCKIFTATPKPPQMAALPAARLTSFTRPFTCIGIDYFGPLIVTVGRRSEKRWGVLITCLTTRAIHVEVAHTLSTDSCIMCLRNFINRRGTPNEIYSDNGTNFHGTEQELRRALKMVDRNTLVDEFNSEITKWHFNPPLCPHMGGSWERLIRSVKTTLYRIMPTRNPSDELLRSMLIEVENIINSRPLTYVPIDDESDEALTPNHFLLGTSNGSKAVGEYNDSGILLKMNWMRSQQFANQFWKRWTMEYLPDLTRRTKWFQPVEPIAEGNMVIIVDENSPRNSWPKGRVVKAITGKDGQVRKAIVQTATGTYERPTVKLAVLDVGWNKKGKEHTASSIPRGSVTNPTNEQGNVTKTTTS